MVTLAIEPALVVVTETYLHTVEDLSRSDHQKLLDTQVKLLCSEEYAKRLEDHLANAQSDEELRKCATQSHEIQREMKWRNRFTTLCFVVAIGLVLVLCWIVIP